MREAVVADEIGALGSFARAGAAEDVDYRDVFGGECGCCFYGGGELARCGRHCCCGGVCGGLGGSGVVGVQEGEEEELVFFWRGFCGASAARRLTMKTYKQVPAARIAANGQGENGSS